MGGDAVGTARSHHRPIHQLVAVVVLHRHPGRENAPGAAARHRHGHHHSRVGVARVPDMRLNGGVPVGEQAHPAGRREVHARVELEEGRRQIGGEDLELEGRPVPGRVDRLEPDAADGLGSLPALHPHRGAPEEHLRAGRGVLGLRGVDGEKLAIRIPDVHVQGGRGARRLRHDVPLDQPLAFEPDLPRGRVARGELGEGDVDLEEGAGSAVDSQVHGLRGS
mmetsp:Transcript_19237/g.51717  ORF Transcript_19237/g.51717 Transcript_19237/m.51717 type:complete len:222 (+) Transcript_19237:1100-1765(+)